MKGSGNGLGTLLRKLYFYCLPTCSMRSRYIKKHEYMFHHVGDYVMWQPRQFPADPELISIGDNVKLAANVSFTNHDILYGLFNCKYHTDEFKKHQGCIPIGDNVMIGANTMILPNVLIGNNVVVGGGSIITKDIPDNCVAAGVPCRVIGSFEDIEKKYRKIEFFESPGEYWEAFNKKRIKD